VQSPHPFIWKQNFLPLKSTLAAPSLFQHSLAFHKALRSVRTQASYLLISLSISISVFSFSYRWNDFISCLHFSTCSLDALLLIGSRWGFAMNRKKNKPFIYWFTSEDITGFLWHKLKKTKRVNKCFFFLDLKVDRYQRLVNIFHKKIRFMNINKLWII